MTLARHPRPPELVGMPLEEIARRHVARFRERKADWAAFEDAKLEGYRRLRLGPWECIACPPGVIHGYVNDSLAPVYFQVMLGKARPDTMGYANDELYAKRDAHLK